MSDELRPKQRRRSKYSHLDDSERKRIIKDNKNQRAMRQRRELGEAFEDLSELLGYDCNGVDAPDRPELMRMALQRISDLRIHIAVTQGTTPPPPIAIPTNIVMPPPRKAVVTTTATAPPLTEGIAPAIDLRSASDSSSAMPMTEDMFHMSLLDTSTSSTATTDSMTTPSKASLATESSATTPPSLPPFVAVPPSAMQPFATVAMAATQQTATSAPLNFALPSHLSVFDLAPPPQHCFPQPSDVSQPTVEAAMALNGAMDASTFAFDPSKMNLPSLTFSPISDRQRTAIKHETAAGGVSVPVQSSNLHCVPQSVEASAATSGSQLFVQSLLGEASFH